MNRVTRNLRWMPNGIGEEDLRFVNVPTLRSAFVASVLEASIYGCVFAVVVAGFAVFVPAIGLPELGMAVLNCGAFVFLHLWFLAKRHSFVVTDRRILSKLKMPVMLGDVVDVQTRRRALIVSTQPGQRHVYPFVCNLTAARDAVIGAPS